MKLRGSFSLLTLVIFGLICGNVYALDAENSLKGLEGINVVVEQIGEESGKDGLTAEAVTADVEQKLSLAGIPVLSEKEWLKEPGRPYLYINANVSKQAGGGYYYCIAVELTQMVTLVRSPNVQCRGGTWNTVGVGASKELRDIRDRIKDQVDIFISAYLSMSPRK